MSSRFQDLRVWKKAMELATLTYRVSDRFPKEERFGLTAQIRRAAVSIPSNIAEGKGRNTDKEFCVFLFNARGSLMELQTQLLLAKELRFVGEDDVAPAMEVCAQVGSGLAGLINSMRK